MGRVQLMLDDQLYEVLRQAAQANRLSLEEECLRRLDGGTRRSRYVQALVEELRADQAQAQEQARSQRSFG
ncbi:hypothetical protein [Pseudomonas sp. NPDC007930]|uniref:hypothetical protein n=1 Tax=Pseudomonas sp. NPDC007930 TaxID=3364417 RepID=UPI0036E4C54B